MGRRTRKRSKLANRVVVASVALMMGGGGLVAVNVYASADEGQSGRSGQQTQNAAQASTIDCPEAANGLPRDVPSRARAEVDRELATMDSQITDAYQRFAEQRDRIRQDPAVADDDILDPLKASRQASIDRIAAAISRGGTRWRGMQGMAPCTLRGDDDGDGNGTTGNSRGGSGGNNGGGNGGTGGGSQGGTANGGQAGGGNSGGNGGQASNGPAASDFVDIRSVRPNVKTPKNRRNASRGTFTTNCGVNRNGLFNPDNVIVAPGVSNGAHHMHDYVGNQANDAFASDDDLANGATTCRNRGDRSSYYWPVLRLQNGQNENDANEDGGGKDQNVGEIQTPAEVSLRFVGSPNGRVTAMPRLLRIITGDAKAFVNGPGNANASWSCTGFENRQLKDKYPICPRGSKVVRTFTFQSCWDGQNIDSANHRTHVAFADGQGKCQNGFKAIPQLVQRIVYNVPPGPGFAVDSFPEQLHKPITDHGDFINVFDESLMNRMVNCINRNQRCT
ncbi:DUF1996 domain-containing protein [Streptomyces sp. NPDC004609]|uniref:DUF1996 domain-containing protein n=1 Tax=Streptomyces sp. NPDC004609 TaxID=3364704 RepID=UPI003695EF79